MRELSLFTGAGGGLLGSHVLGWRPIGYVEKDDYCQRVIAARIRDGLIPLAPIFSDVKAFIGEGYAASYQGMVDVVSAGFPCQPFSVAGRRRAVDDERNQWPATADVIRITRPRWVFLENVPGLLSASHGYFGEVLRDLAGMGYDVRWGVLSAAEAGAPHLRKRLWIVGTTQGRVSDSERNSLRQQRKRDRKQCDEPGTTEPWGDGEERAVADANCNGLEDLEQGRATQGTAVGSNPDEGLGSPMGSVQSLRQLLVHDPPETRPRMRVSAGGPGGDRPIQPECTWWESEPDVGRVVDGVASRVDRLRAIGNGQVPAVVRLAWKMLSEES